MLRQEYLRAHPLCERCKRDGLVRSAIDVHHKVPVESAHTIAEMEQLAYDWNNLQALCIPCHASIHKAERSHSKQAHKQREDDRLERWKERQQRGQSGACISSAEREAPRTECKAKQQRQQPPTDGEAPT